MNAPLYTRLQQLDDKIKLAEQEKQSFLDQYYVSIMKRLQTLEIHRLPPEVMVGCLLEALQKYEIKDSSIQRWERLGYPFFRPKRSRTSAASNPSSPATSTQLLEVGPSTPASTSQHD